MFVLRKAIEFVSPQALFATERSAVGGAAWNDIAAIRSSGTIIAGGARGTFTQIIDQQNGYSQVVADTGPLHDVSGFDGTSWDEQNGIVTQADLPSLQADAVTQAYVARDGWWNASDSATMKVLGQRADGGFAAEAVNADPVSSRVEDALRRLRNCGLGHGRGSLASVRSENVREAFNR